MEKFTLLANKFTLPPAMTAVTNLTSDLSLSVLYSQLLISNQDLCNDIGYTLPCLNLTRLNWSQGKLQGEASSHEGDGEPSQSVQKGHPMSKGGSDECSKKYCLTQSFFLGMLCHRFICANHKVYWSEGNYFDNQRQFSRLFTIQGGVEINNQQLSIIKY